MEEKKRRATADFCEGEGAADGGERLKDSSVERRRTGGEQGSDGRSEAEREKPY